MGTTGKVGGQVACLTVLARPHRVNGWLLRLAARPYLRLDGVERPLTWGAARTFRVAPGAHTLQTFWRYRGVRSPLGTGTLTVQAHDGGELFVLARNGPLNHQPLRPRLTDPPEPGDTGASG